MNNQGTAMNYVGVDIHKRYSFLSATDEQGHKLREARIEGNAPAAFEVNCTRQPKHPSCDQFERWRSFSATNPAQ